LELAADPIGIREHHASMCPVERASNGALVGPEAVKAARLTPSERRDIWLSALGARYGSKTLSPKAHLETDWAVEEWTLGGMISHFACGVATNFGHVLREPAGRIHWAGTERAIQMHGLMEGAVRSGESAADAVVNSEA
jgi:monoamine oxidase